MAKKKSERAGTRQTSRIAMNKLKKSQNIAITLMVVILIVGIGLMVFCYVFDNWDVTTQPTAEQGQKFKVDSLLGKAPVEISIETTAKIPPKFFILSAYNFKEISPTTAVANEATDPESIELYKQASVYWQDGKKDFKYEEELENDDYFVIVVTNQTEGGVAFNMVYDISVYDLRPIVIPIIFPIVFVLEIFSLVYILLLNNKLKKVQEKVSTQRLLKAQMDMVRNFILQSSGASQQFSLSSSPYKSVTGESVPRDGIPLAISTKEMEIVECYACNELISVNSPDRPLIVACPNCGVKSQVVEEEEGEEGPAPQVTSTLPPAAVERKLLPAGTPPPDEGASAVPVPQPAPVPSPAPVPNTSD
jgi:hypothetical protein